MCALSNVDELCTSPPKFTAEEREKIRNFHPPGPRLGWTGAVGSHPGGVQGYKDFCEAHDRKMADLLWWG